MSTSIGMIVRNYYATDARVRRYAEALTLKGYKVHIFAIKDRRRCISYDLNRVKVYQVPMTKKRKSLIGNIFENGLFAFIMMIWLSFMFLKHKYRIIHVHNMPDFLVFSAIIPKVFNSKIIIDIHDPFPEFYAAKFQSKLKKKLGKLLFFEEKLSLNFADYIITSTDIIKSSLIEKGFDQNKVSTILNIPDHTLFNPDNYPSINRTFNNDSFVLLFAGTIAERNGIEKVIRALPQLRKTIPGICYHIIGRGEYLEELKQLVQKLNLENVVAFKGLTPLEEIPLEILYSNAVVWFPERSEFMDMVLSVKVMEALIMGIPVITLKTRCHSYYYNDNELIFVESSNVSEIIKSVNELYLNYKHYSHRSIETRRITSKFNWEIEKNSYLSLIESLTIATFKNES